VHLHVVQFHCHVSPHHLHTGGVLFASLACHHVCPVGRRFVTNANVANLGFDFASVRMASSVKTPQSVSHCLGTESVCMLTWGGGGGETTAVERRVNARRRAFAKRHTFHHIAVRPRQGWNLLMLRSNLPGGPKALTRASGHAPMRDGRSCKS
jgi:hypothetical protein